MTVALCCDYQKSNDMITAQLTRLCSVTVVSFYSISEFLTEIDDYPNTVMGIAQKELRSTETAISAINFIGRAGRITYAILLDGSINI